MSSLEDPSIEKYRNELEKEKTEALKRFKIAYENHLDFIKEKGITIDNPSAFTLSNSMNQEDLKKTVLNEMLLKINGVNKRFYDCLLKKEKLNQTINSFDKIFPKILNFTTDFLSTLLKIKLDGNKEKISSDSQLLCFRSLFFIDTLHLSNIEGAKELYNNLKKQVTQVLSEVEIQLKPDFSTDNLLYLILQSTFEGLAK